MNVRRLAAAAVILGAVVPVAVSAASATFTPVCITVEAGRGWNWVANQFAPTISGAARDAFVQRIWAYEDNSSNLTAGELVCIDPRDPALTTAPTSSTTVTSVASTTVPLTSTTSPAFSTTTSPAATSTAPSTSTSTTSFPSTTSAPNTTTSTVPPQTGFPNASNTGVPAITLHDCPTNITASGTYDACRFAEVIVRATNVTITRSQINGRVTTGPANLLIVDSTIDCHCPSTSNNSTPIAIGESNFTLRRVEVTNAGHGVAVANNVLIEDSWIHGLGGNTSAHKDGIYSGDGSNVTLRHNTIECADPGAQGCTAAIGILSDFGVITNWVIDGNLLNTIGSYCLYADGGPQKPYHAHHITVTNNTFGQVYSSLCGTYGPVAYWDPRQPGMIWSGNHWPNGTIIPAPTSSDA